MICVILLAFRRYLFVWAVNVHGLPFFLFHRMNCMQHVMNCRKHYMTRKLQTGSWKYSDGWMCILVVRWYHPTGVNRRSKNRAQGRLTCSTRGTFTNVLHIHSFDMCLSLTSVRKIDLVPKDVCVLKHQNLLSSDPSVFQSVHQKHSRICRSGWNQSCETSGVIGS